MCLFCTFFAPNKTLILRILFPRNLSHVKTKIIKAIAHVFNVPAQSAVLISVTVCIFLLCAFICYYSKNDSGDTPCRRYQRKNKIAAHNYPLNVSTQASLV